MQNGYTLDQISISAAETGRAMTAVAAVAAVTTVATAATATGEIPFSLTKFEYFCYGRQHEQAARELVRLLKYIDDHFGVLPPDLHPVAVPGTVAELPADQAALHVLNRITSAISALFSDAGFVISRDGFKQLIVYQRWLTSLFAASGFIHCDHILRSLNPLGPDAVGFQLAERDLVKFCLLYSPESDMPLDVNLLWQQDRQLAAGLFFALLSPRFLGTPAAHAKREALLAWLPARLDEIDAPDALPLGILHDVYMHCSYADLPARHAIKAPINRLVRRKLSALGLHDIDSLPVDSAPPEQPETMNKPVMLVLVEWFTVSHSIYRTHSQTLAAARRHFHVMAIAYGESIDPAGRAVFDEVLEFSQPDDLVACLQQVRAIAAARRPAVFYMPSVGMFPITLFAANLRLAPLQVAALGHPASTQSDRIDYISVEDDFVGDPACFSEALLRLPRDGQPYWPPVIGTVRDGAAARIGRSDRTVVDVAVAATALKLNPGFLQACREIQARAGHTVRFHFLVGQAQGLVTPQVQRLIHRFLPTAEVYAHRPYAQYMAILDGCDMFISPFPFGNTNGIVDAVVLGLPGVCKTGPEVFEHIDEALLRRLQLPEWTIAATVAAYIEAAVRMADNFAERTALYRHLQRPGALDALFKGRPESLGDGLLELLQKQNSGRTQHKTAK